MPCDAHTTRVCSSSFLLERSDSLVGLGQGSLEAAFVSQCQAGPRAKTQRRPVTGALLNAACPASSPTAHTLPAAAVQVCLGPFIHSQSFDGTGYMPGSRETRETKRCLYPVELLVKWAETDTEIHINSTVGKERARINRASAPPFCP